MFVQRLFEDLSKAPLGTTWDVSLRRFVVYANKTSPRVRRNSEVKDNLSFSSIKAGDNLGIVFEVRKNKDATYWARVERQETTTYWVSVSDVTLTPQFTLTQNPTAEKTAIEVKAWIDQDIVTFESLLRNYITARNLQKQGKDVAKEMAILQGLAVKFMKRRESVLSRNDLKNEMKIGINKQYEALYERYKKEVGIFGDWRLLVPIVATTNPIGIFLGLGYMVLSYLYKLFTANKEEALKDYMASETVREALDKAGVKTGEYETVIKTNLVEPAYQAGKTQKGDLRDIIDKFTSSELYQKVRSGLDTNDKKIKLDEETRKLAEEAYLNGEADRVKNFGSSLLTNVVIGVGLFLLAQTFVKAKARS